MKKLAPPIIVTLIVIAYFIFYFAILCSVISSKLLLAAFAIIPLALSAVAIYVCIQRIQEIRSGQEDDLSKY